MILRPASCKLRLKNAELIIMGWIILTNWFLSLLVLLKLSIVLNTKEIPRMTEFSGLAIVPNKAGYTSIRSIQAILISVLLAVRAYPKLVNKDWLLFVSSAALVLMMAQAAPMDVMR